MLPIVLMVCIFIVDQATTRLGFVGMKHYGIIARNPANLVGIILTPFIHANWNHLLGNSASLWTLLLLLGVFYKNHYWLILVSITLLCGTLTWLIGDEGIHIGASGVVYGLAAFILVAGFIQKRIAPIIASLTILFAYNWLITGLFPSYPTLTEAISYSSHWSGVIAGILAALICLRKFSPTH